LELAGGIYDSQGQLVAGPFGRRAELDLSAADHERAAQAGLQYQQQLPLRPGRYEVRLVAHELKLAQLGGATQWIEIPDLADKTLATSSIFLSASSSSAAAGTNPREALHDVHTLRRFKRGESLYFQLYVYNPLRDEKGQSDVMLQAQLWSAQKV